MIRLLFFASLATVSYSHMCLQGFNENNNTPWRVTASTEISLQPHSVFKYGNNRCINFIFILSVISHIKKVLTISAFCNSANENARFDFDAFFVNCSFLKLKLDSEFKSFSLRLFSSENRINELAVIGGDMTNYLIFYSKFRDQELIWVFEKDTNKYEYYSFEIENGIPVNLDIPDIIEVKPPYPELVRFNYLKLYRVKNNNSTLGCALSCHLLRVAFRMISFDNKKEIYENKNFQVSNEINEFTNHLVIFAIIIIIPLLIILTEKIGKMLN